MGEVIPAPAVNGWVGDQEEQFVPVNMGGEAMRDARHREDQQYPSLSAWFHSTTQSPLCSFGILFLQCIVVNLTLCACILPFVFGLHHALESFLSAFRACVSLCVITCTIVQILCFQSGISSKYLKSMMIIGALSCAPAVTVYNLILSNLGTGDIIERHPLKAATQSAFAQSVAFFISGVFIFLLTRLTYMFFSILEGKKHHPNTKNHQMENNGKPPDKIADSGNIEEGQPANAPVKKTRSRRNKYIRTLRILCYSVLRVFAMSVFFFLLVVASISLYVWRPKSPLLAEVWSIFVSGLVLPCCVIGVKWTVTLALKDLAALYLRGKGTSKASKSIKFMEIMLLSGKSVECFFNVTKVMLIFSAPSTSQFVFVSLCAIVSQVILITITTKISVHYDKNRRIRLHQDISQFDLSEEQEQARPLYMRMLGIASIGRNPSLYKNTSIWTILLVYESQANIISIIGTSFYLGAFSKNVPGDLLAKTCILLLCFLLKPLIVYMIYPKLIPDDPQFCRTFSASHGLMASLLDRIIVVTWLICAIPLLVQGQMQNEIIAHEHKA